MAADHGDRPWHVNRAWWDDRAAAHAASPEYALARFVEDREHISGVVRFDRPRLFDVAGRSGVHLQCHIGTDTLSLARLGARMTGLDLSPASLAQARALSERAGPSVHYVEGDVYDAVDILGPNAFDFVYTGIGALNWLPDIDRWAEVVAGLLRPGGLVHLREGHPMLWTLDDPEADEKLVVRFAYFETGEPLPLEDLPGQDTTYVTTDAVFTAHATAEWNHGLGEIVTALLDRGFTITRLEEHTSIPWNGLIGLMDEGPDGEWRLRDRPERLPLSYTLQAALPG